MSTRPVKVFKCGLVRVSVFQNDNGSLTATVTKAFKKDGNWEYSKSLFASDCMVATKLMEMASVWMMEEEQKTWEQGKLPAATSRISNNATGSRQPTRPVDSFEDDYSDFDEIPF